MKKDNSDLFKRVWKMAEDMRGSVSSWDFKHYVSAMLFYRFVSSRMLPPKYQFDEVLRRNEGTTGITNDLVRVFAIIGENVPALFADLDLSSGMLGKHGAEREDRLKALMQGITDLEFDDSAADIMGDTYEYMLMMYTSHSGNKGGEFYTPQGVSTLLSRIVMHDRAPKRIYDPTCGSGSLLINFARHCDDLDRVELLGQEINMSSYNMCKINLYLRQMDNPQINFDIAYGDTLTDPHDFGGVDAVVANPPFGISWQGKDNPKLVADPRFSPADALAPKSKADLAFVMHAIHHMRDDAVAAMVLYPGALYRLGDEAKVRKYMLEQNYVDAIIQLPKDLFKTTGIETSILILRKERTDDKVFFINAENFCDRDESKNFFRAADIDQIMKIYADRKAIDGVSAFALIERMLENECNFSPRFYIPKKDDDESFTIEDLKAHAKHFEDLAERNYQRRKRINDLFSEWVRSYKINQKLEKDGAIFEMSDTSA